jgi:hypothetical protein
MDTSQFNMQKKLRSRLLLEFVQLLFALCFGFLCVFFLSQWNNRINQQKPFYSCWRFKNRKEPQTQQERIHKQAVNKESLKACILHGGPMILGMGIEDIKGRRKKIGSLPNDHKTQRYMYWNDQQGSKGLYLEYIECKIIKKQIAFIKKLTNYMITLLSLMMSSSLPCKKEIFFNECKKATIQIFLLLLLTAVDGSKPCWSSPQAYEWLLTAVKYQFYTVNSCIK